MRGPQQDALRSYLKVHDTKDVAFELPTGAGKTTIGLLIAEWQRRQTRGRAAYLTLTNQLASQVIEEARRLSISVADLRGSKERRSGIEEGKFLDCSTVAVSTYSNLFNVNPIINQSETLILDDAHGGGEFAASMWTVRVSSDEYRDIHEDLLAVLTPLMTETQVAELLDQRSFNRIGIVDLGAVPSAKESLVRTLDRLPQGDSARYAWSLVRARLHACHIFVSRDVVTIRPHITPTYDHAPFATVKHRIYLSATLGDVEDLRRAYAIDKVEDVRVKSEYDGRRYVFVPGLGMNDSQISESINFIWEDLEPKRAVAIAPSFSALNRLQSVLQTAIRRPRFAILDARDVEESLSPFTGRTNILLGLANRYDGLDLPDDDCRLLMLADSPRATNELETNLSSVWKLGPALRWREATRLAQGMGRCTRNATDFAVILLLGESLINAATNGSLLRLLPPTLQREIEWGRAQVKELGLTPASFAEVVIGLITDADYRKEANDSIAEESYVSSSAKNAKSLAIASTEVAHSRAIWEGDYSRAQELASEIVDRLSGEEWAGYRAWWLYLTSIAARHADNVSAEMDALRRAKGTGINAGWLDHLSRMRQQTFGRREKASTELSMVVAERIWTTLEELGWSGKRFNDFCEGMLSDIATIENHKIFHRGLESLGRLVGALATRSTEQGDPDVIWRLGDKVWVCFEAKTEKLAHGLGISKKDVLEAKGHVNWVRFFEAQGKRDVEIMATIIAPTPKTHRVAEAHKDSLYFLGTTGLLEWGKKVNRGLTELRTKYVGQEFGAARLAFARDLERLGLSYGTTVNTIRKTPL